jgi:hypothetical protein
MSISLDEDRVLFDYTSPEEPLSAYNTFTPGFAGGLPSSSWSFSGKRTSTSLGM